jgi:hypothetical protein
MTDDPLEKVIEVFADASERLVEYADVWRSAIERNARDDYAADDFLVDLQALWGMGVRDVARVGAVFVETIAPFLGSDAFGSRYESTDEGGGGADSS